MRRLRNVLWAWYNRWNVGVERNRGILSECSAESPFSTFHHNESAVANESKCFWYPHTTSQTMEAFRAGSNRYTRQRKAYHLSKRYHHLLVKIMKIKISFLKCNNNQMRPLFLVAWCWALVRRTIEPSYPRNAIVFVCFAHFISVVLLVFVAPCLQLFNTDELLKHLAMATTVSPFAFMWGSKRVYLRSWEHLYNEPTNDGNFTSLLTIANGKSGSGNFISLISDSDCCKLQT